MSVFSDRLKLAMTEKNITQAQLAKMTEIPKSAINQYLSGRFMPKKPRIEIISRALGINTAWLLGLTDTDCGCTGNGITSVLSHFEYGLIMSLREDRELFAKVTELIFEHNSDSTFFRAAKSRGGDIPPSNKPASPSTIVTLGSAPETDEDL